MNLLCFKFHCSYSNSFTLSSFGDLIWSWLLKGCRSSEKEKENRCLVFTSAIKREIRKVHVVIVQWRQSDVQKSVIHLQSCSFVSLILLLFCRFRCRRPRLCLIKPPVHEQDKRVTCKCELERDTRAKYEIRGWSAIREWSTRFEGGARGEERREMYFTRPFPSGHDTTRRRKFPLNLLSILDLFYTWWLMKSGQFSYYI